MLLVSLICRLQAILLNNYVSALSSPVSMEVQCSLYAHQQGSCVNTASGSFALFFCAHVGCCAHNACMF